MYCRMIWFLKRIIEHRAKGWRGTWTNGTRRRRRRPACCVLIVCIVFGGQCMPSSSRLSLSRSAMDPLPLGLRNPSSLFYQKDALRRSIIKAYWVIISLAVPLWWYTTSIERLALPSSRIEQLVDKHLQLPVNICAPSSRISNLKNELSSRHMQDRKRWDGLEVKLEENEICGACALVSVPYKYQFGFRARKVVCPGAWSVKYYFSAWTQSRISR